jgi:type II secretory pathway predicted ATPase ExeA
VYTNFYNLKEKPFNLTPSPRFLYLGETHKEALSLLSYGVMEAQGFVLLTGEVGTGKTTIVQTLLNNLDSAVHYVYLSNPTLAVNDFLLYVASGLGLQTEFKSKGTFLIQFEGFLQGLLQQQKNVLLIVDEAQKLSFRLLEEIRLLSNMETADRKLINIFLVGQPELNHKLRQAQCRPLLQRISIRYHIRPLNLTETEDYIKTRLRAAGARDSKLLPKNVIETVHTYAMGYPRMINILCDNALLLGYAREKKQITVSMIEECYNDLGLPESFLQTDTNAPINEVPKVAEPMKERSYLRPAALAFLLFLLLILSSVTDTGKRYVHTAMLFYRAFTTPEISPPDNDPSETSPKISQAISRGGAKKEAAEDSTTLNRKPAMAVSPQPEQPPNTEPVVQQQGVPKPEKRVITIKPGDTLLRLSRQIYGSADEKILASIQRENPEIKDINNIEVGQKIIFPPLKGIPWEKYQTQ